jgi:hypothetical protein
MIFNYIPVFKVPLVKGGFRGFYTSLFSKPVPSYAEGGDSGNIHPPFQKGGKGGSFNFQLSNFPLI